MRVFITGHKGQLGRTLFAQMNGQVNGQASRPASGYMLAGCDLPELDITDREAIRKAIVDCTPDVVIHAAAWTDVDGCAREPDRAFLANAIGTQNVALACAACDAAMVYISTNEVFDGKATQPYREWDTPQPINPYGRSKAAGEWFVRHLLQRFYIVRTAWLYASGGRNFPHRIMQLADERGALRVVADEIGNPTYTPDLVSALATLIETEAYGAYHLTNSGFCSRYDFAQEILSLTDRGQIPVEPITQADFERASVPPTFAPLANTAAAAHGIHLRPWQEALADFLSD